jgi:hypothetical protein
VHQTTQENSQTPHFIWSEISGVVWCATSVNSIYLTVNHIQNVSIFIIIYYVCNMPSLFVGREENFGQWDCSVPPRIYNPTGRKILLSH